MTRRPRKLRPAEAELWQQVIATAQPMHAPIARPDEPDAPPAADPEPDTPGLRLSSLIRRARPSTPKVSVDLAPTATDRLSPSRIDMDRKKFGKMKRGKLVPDARIDLHGMTQAQAHAELRNFILLSHEMGHRLVLVITGKPRDMSDQPFHATHPRGILRQQVPHWLEMPPLRPLVLQITESHISHGGSGAIYVYLRRSRSG